LSAKNTSALAHWIVFVSERTDKRHHHQTPNLPPHDRLPAYVSSPFLTLGRPRIGLKGPPRGFEFGFLHGDFSLLWNRRCTILLLLLLLALMFLFECREERFKRLGLFHTTPFALVVQFFPCAVSFSSRFFSLSSLRNMYCTRRMSICRDIRSACLLLSSLCLLLSSFMQSHSRLTPYLEQSLLAQ